MLPKETVELIQATAVKANTPALIDALDTDGRKGWVFVNGELRDVELPPAPRRHLIHALEDLILYANDVADQKPEAPGCVVWHGRSAVRLVIDDADRRDQVVFPLTLSERFKVLQKLALDRPAMDQTKFVRLLRIELGLDNLAVVAKFRKLDWNLQDTGVGEVKHGQDRLGREIMARVQGIDELPEELDVPAPVYCDPGEREEYVVRCAVEIDAKNQRFQLVPLPDELERVMDLAQTAIRSRLENGLQGGKDRASVPVYYGEP